MSMNPFDEIAVEEAVRLKEAGVATEVVARPWRGRLPEETLRTAMAIGATAATSRRDRCLTLAAGRRQAAQGPVRQGSPRW